MIVTILADKMHQYCKGHQSTAMVCNMTRFESSLVEPYRVVFHLVTHCRFPISMEGSSEAYQRMTTNFTKVICGEVISSYNLFTYLTATSLFTGNLAAWLECNM